MAKIRELIADREKLAKYDELTEWKGHFTRELYSKELALRSGLLPYDINNLNGGKIYYKIPDHIKQIIVSALDAEIKKLEEE